MNTTKIAVMSDSHDNTDNIGKIATIANERECSYLFHLGDIVTPSTAQKLTAFKGIVRAVFGNCDAQFSGLKRVFNNFGGEIERPPYSFTLEDKKLTLMHEPYRLQELIDSGNSDYIFYGHLHKVDTREVGKTMVFNPGDAGGGVRKPSFLIISLHSGEYELIEI